MIGVGLHSNLHPTPDVCSANSSKLQLTCDHERDAGGGMHWGGSGCICAGNSVGQCKQKIPCAAEGEGEESEIAQEIPS